jgi:DNA replication and repair protein RecF
VVLFAPEDLRLPRGAPAQRRKFLDRAIWNGAPAYLGEAQTYDRVLRSRNAVLREGGARDDLLDVYDEQLAKAAAPIVARRRRLVEELRPRAQRAFERVTGGLRLDVSHETLLDFDEAQIPVELLAKLRAERGRDRARGATSSGPHTDDLALVLDGRAASAYASQGQLRAIVLALKIAEIELTTDRIGDPPVLLLDDVSSELDPTRNAQLFEFLRGVRCQAFITTTQATHVLLTEERKDYRVLSGTISD